MLLGKHLDVAPLRSLIPLSPRWSVVIGRCHRTAATPKSNLTSFFTTAGHSRNGVYLSHQWVAGNRYCREQTYLTSVAIANSAKHATSLSRLQKMSVPEGQPGPYQPSRSRSCWIAEMSGKSSMD